MPIVKLEGLTATFILGLEKKMPLVLKKIYGK